MNAAEAARLLTVASGFDNRIVDELKATAWARALSDVSYAEGEAAVIAHFKDAATRNEYLTVGRLLDRVEADKRLLSRQVEADVRAAKARGLVEWSWPERELLPESVRLELARLRERDAFESVKALEA